MDTPLDRWQARLERHFASLAEKRAGTGFPIFALEHGLSDGDLAEISAHLLSRLKAGLPLRTHWLLWVIYATERGYGYAGDEYWRSFEQHTPFWDASERYKVVQWFTKFQKAYDGVIPTGPWASHFRIIAWPITHAILPRYLQHQFARALYELRYRLAGLVNFEPASIGRLLTAYAHASTRFEEFLQQEELTGRIVLALLGQTRSGGHEPIYPPTLSRVVSDLERVRSAREWLKEARREVTDRFKGIGRGSGPSSSYPSAAQRSSDKSEQPRPNIRPNLMLRYSMAGAWSLVMDVPDFNSLALNAEIRAFLKSTRCRLNGADDTKPAGWLLSGKRKAILKAWPDPKRPLLQFEASNSTLDHLIESDCQLSLGPNWLFRIGQDGIAREITGRIVRPGYNYVVITSNEVPDAHPFTGPCTVECTGVKSFRLNMPDAVSADDITWLNALGLQLARTIRVWPAGLPGRAWDGEGNSEWLTTEAPCFGITHDFPVEAYGFRLDDGAETKIEAGPVGFPTFFQLQPMSEGVHTLKVQAKTDSFGPKPSTERLVDGFLVLNVREPAPWTPGRTLHAGLIVTIDPHDANLDTFWENLINVTILGPESHRVTCEVTLTKIDGEEIFSEQVGEAMDLPVMPETWSRRFAQFLLQEDCAWRYLEASAGYFVIRGEELGEYIFRFEHDALPIRWVVRNEDRRLSARLIDDTGEERTEPVAYFYRFERPAFAETLSIKNALSGSEVTVPGGLFVATQGQYRDAIVVSAGLSGPGLLGLGVGSDFSDVVNGSVDLGQACRMSQLWRTARLAGPLAAIRREQVSNGLLCAIYKAICGSNWARAEDVFCANPNSPQTVDGLQRNIDKYMGFGAVLRRDFERINDGFGQATQWYVEVAGRYRVCEARRLCEFAMLLAFQPHLLVSEFGNDLDALFKEIRTCPGILRGARMLALLSANQGQNQPAIRIPRWR